MTIFHICDIATPSNGIYTVLKELSAYQKKLGQNVKILNGYKNGVKDQDFIFSDIETFKKMLDSHNPDIIIFHGVFYKHIISFSRELRNRNIPYLIELHGALSKQNVRKSRYRKLFYRILFLDHILRNSNGIIYLNDKELVNSTIRSINSHNIVLPNGCISKTLHANEIATNKKEFIFIGRIDRIHKGLDILISAIKKLFSTYNNLDFHFSFYGNGSKEDVDWLQEELKNFKGKLDYYGAIYGDEKEKALLKSNIFILTSRYEGFPMTILEALSFGLPCIVTPGTNVADIITNNNCGWVADLTIQSVADTIYEAYLCNTETFPQLKDNCINTAKKYDWAEIAKESITQYKLSINR